MTQSLEFMTHALMVLLGTLHLSFSCSSDRVVSFGRSLFHSPKWFDCYSCLIWSFESLSETSQGEPKSLVRLQRHLRHHLSFRIGAFVFVCQPFKSCFTNIPMGVSFVLRQRSLRSPHYSHFLFIPVFIFLTLVSSTEEGHICRPPFRHGSLFFLYLFLWITFLARCHYPSRPHVTSLVAIRNQPRFLKLQQDFDTWRNFLEGGPVGRQGAWMREKERGLQKGWCRKRWRRQRSRREKSKEKVVEVEIGKEKSEKKVGETAEREEFF